MTSDPKEEARKIVKEYFAKKIASTKEQANEYKLKFDDACSQKESTAIKAFYVSAHISRVQHAETLEILEGLTDTLFNLSDDLRAKILELDKTTQNIAKETGVDISAMQTEVVDLKQVILPAVKGMVNLLDRLDKDEERRKKNGEIMIV